MKKKITVFLIAIISLFALVSCDKNNNSIPANSIPEVEYHKVAFDTKGGTVIESQNVVDGKKALKPEDPVREGYTFVDWYYRGERWIFVAYTVTEDMTIEAVWEPNEYSLELSKNNNAAGSITSGDTYEFGEEITIEATSNWGYVFAGWYCGDELLSSNLIYTFNMPAKNVKFEARWTKGKYTITLDPNGGEVLSNVFEVNWGENYTLPVPTNTEGIFTGWYYNGVQMTDEYGKSLMPYQDMKDETFTTQCITEISTYKDFISIGGKQMGYSNKGYYVLKNDIDMSEAKNYRSSLGDFAGVIDGNGHTLKNFELGPREYAGLFTKLEGATIKNLKLENFSLELTSLCKNVGALAGYMVNTTIENVTVDGFSIITSSGATTTAQIGGLCGSISSTDNKTSKIINSNAMNVSMNLTQVRPSTNYIFYAGAFAGRISGKTTVTNCETSGVLNCYGRSSSGIAHIGGFAGAIESSQVVSNCESFVSISMIRQSNTFSNLCIGGFVGSNGTGQINLNNCLAVGDIEAIAEAKTTSTTSKLAFKAYIGGIAGLVSFSTEGVKNCYHTSTSVGILVMQANENDCYVSKTIAYVSDAIKNKVANVYSYDECYDVTGMIYVPSTINKNPEQILSQELSSDLSEAVQLSGELAVQTMKLGIDKYSFSTTYSSYTQITFSEDIDIIPLNRKYEVNEYNNIVETYDINYENNILSINPKINNFIPVRFVLRGNSISLNIIIFINTSV